MTADATEEPRQKGAPAAAPPGYLAPGVLVDGKYEIQKILGEGGMGVVYLARDIHTETPVVVKSILAQFANDPDFRARTLAEGRALARIDHPNVVRLNAVVVEAKMLYLVMQFIDGEPLDRMIERHVAAHAPLPVSLTLSIFRMILKGVGAAHAEGLIHRDLKPANILVRKKDGVAKVTDFGIAKGEEDAKAGRGVTKGIIGSLSYMAPEQVRGQRDLDKRVDIYALGILLFEMLVGEPPFDAPSDFEVMRMHAEAPMPSVGARRPDAPHYLDDVVQRACAKDRALRFANTDDFLAALDPPHHGPLTSPTRATDVAPDPGHREVSSTAIASPPPWHGGAGPASRVVTEEGASLPPGPKPAPRRRASVIATAGGVTVMALGAALLFLRSREQPSPLPAAVARREDASAPSFTPSIPPDLARRPSPLTALAGSWRSSSNRDYTAVLTGDDTLEFRIQQASQHPRQGYEKGEVRFKLLAILGKSDEFAVEDHIRPTPPTGIEYDPRTSRENCVGTWTSVKGRRLLAQFDGASALTVDLVQIRTGLEKFKIEGKHVAGCVDLASSPAEPIESKLSRKKTE